MITRIDTAPTEYPVSLSEVKTHLRLETDDTTEDTHLSALIDAAVLQAEDLTGRRLVTQTWEAVFDSWEAVECVLPFGNLQSITSVKYQDEDNETQTVSPDDYQVVGVNTDCGGLVFPAESDFDYPSIWDVEPISVKFVCGYGDAEDVPEPIKHVIKLIVADLYAFRESGLIGVSYADIPIIYNLVAPYRLWGNL